jgi:hypothetical protein
MDSAARLKSGKLQGSLDLKRKGSTSLRVFLGNHIFRLDLGLGERSNNRGTFISLKSQFQGRIRQVALAHSQMAKRKVGMDLDRVLLLLARSFEGYSSS